MKGAIGNALIMNMVITFIIIFFSLLIGSMAYSKAYKTKNFILNALDEHASAGKTRLTANSEEGRPFNEKVNEYLGRIGYQISTKNNNCPTKESYIVAKYNNAGDYEYCIYQKRYITDRDNNAVIKEKYNYMVLVYMRFDIPVIGQFIKIPITGETKTYTEFR